MNRVVSREEMQQVIETVKGSSAISVYAETVVDMNKTGNPYFGAVKRNWIAGLIGFDYGNSVNNQLGREEKDLDFTPQAHKWAIMPENGCRNLRQNKDRSKTYLWLKVQSAETPTYWLGGNEISKDEIAPYLKAHVKPHTQDNVAKEIVPRTYDLANILVMRILGDELTVGETITESQVEAVEVPVEV